MLRQFWLDINYESVCQFMAAYPPLTALPLPRLPPTKNSLQIIRYCTCDKPKLKSVCQLMATKEEENVEQQGAIGSEEGCTLLLSIRPINSKLLDRSSVAGDYDTFRFLAPIADCSNRTRFF